MIRAAMKKVSDSLPVHIIRTKNKYGDACYFVVRASNAQFQKLMAQKQKGSVNIADYAEVLTSGYGEKPNESVCVKLREQYGIKLPT